MVRSPSSLPKSFLLICLFCRGIVNSFGAFQTFYEADLLLSSTPSAISWIGSIQGFLILNVSVLSGPIFDMGYLKSLICGGSLMLLFGLIMTSLATEYYQILLAHGICVGLGGGFLFIPSVAILATYFQKRRSFAIGLAATGSSLGKEPSQPVVRKKKKNSDRIMLKTGGIIYPAAFRELQPKIGFPWATRIMAFIALGTLSISVAVLKRRIPIAGKRKLFDTSAWKEPPYVLFVVGGFLGFVGLYVPFFFTSAFAIGKIGASEKLGFYFIPILNAASTLGRIIPNLLADRVGPLNVLIPCTLAAGVLVFSWIAVHDIGGLVAFTVLYGFFSGTFVSLPPSTIASLSSDLDTVGTRMGIRLGTG